MRNIRTLTRKHSYPNYFKGKVPGIFIIGTKGATEEYFPFKQERELTQYSISDYFFLLYC
jgi:hypothetical protein